MARPREFDEKAALAQAMDLFWRKGYEATSVDDLLTTMGISRASLYATFGDKHRLYERALDLYYEKHGAPIVAALSGPGGIEERLGAALRVVIEDARRGDRRGCMATNTLVELANLDPPLRRTSRRMLDELERVLLETLEAAKADKELPRGADPKALSRFYMATMTGLRVMARGGAPVEAMEDAVRVSLSSVAK